MRGKLSLTGFVVAIAAALVISILQPQAPIAAAQADGETAAAQGVEDLDALRERGKYLANDVAMCVVCHSPKDEKGLPVKGKEFTGGLIPANPTLPQMDPWAVHAPALRTLAQGAESDVITLLTTGIWPRTGKSPMLPMPPFRLSDSDARAIVLYLQSLDY